MGLQEVVQRTIERREKNKRVFEQLFPDAEERQAARVEFLNIIVQLAEFGRTFGPDTLPVLLRAAADDADVSLGDAEELLKNDITTEEFARAVKAAAA